MHFYNFFSPFIYYNSTRFILSSFWKHIRNTIRCIINSFVWDVRKCPHIYNVYLSYVYIYRLSGLLAMTRLFKYYFSSMIL